MMTSQTALPPLPFPHFIDVAPEELAAEDAMCRSPQEVLQGAWADYLRRVLPPQAQNAAN